MLWELETWSLWRISFRKVVMLETNWIHVRKGLDLQQKPPNFIDFEQSSLDPAEWKMFLSTTIWGYEVKKTF
jgi:hypothetical protein